MGCASSSPGGAHSVWSHMKTLQGLGSNPHAAAQVCVCVCVVR